MELCELYNVSRTSVRQVLTDLSPLDLIEAKSGDAELAAFFKSAC